MDTDTDITVDNYVEKAQRTSPELTFELLSRLNTKESVHLLHAGLGLCTEVGEFVDIIKKHIFYGKEFDFVNAHEELGDIEWYVAEGIAVLQTTLKEILSLNIAKLKERFPERFTETNAIDRNEEAERILLEKADLGKHRK